jgi:hypothetical protein
LGKASTVYPERHIMLSREGFSSKLDTHIGLAAVLGGYSNLQRYFWPIFSPSEETRNKFRIYTFAGFSFRKHTLFASLQPWILLCDYSLTKPG